MGILVYAPGFDDDPPPAAPALCRAEGCEEGTVLLHAGSPYECWAACPECEGTGTLEVSRCEICERTVSDHEIDDAGVCSACFRDMAERLKHEAEEPVVVLHPEVRWALEAGMVTWEQVA